MKVRGFGFAAAALMAVTVASVGVTAYADDGSAAAARPTNDQLLAQYLRTTMDGLRFQDVLDLAPPSSTAAKSLAVGVDKDATSTAQRASRYAAVAADDTAQPIRQQPQINASVLELDDAGHITASATVLMSPQYPHGVVVPVDPNHHTAAVRWRQWEDDGWYANGGQGTIDVVPGRADAPLDFMLPYPASVLKLMVNFGVLRLVDAGVVSLDDTYDYAPTTISSLCGGASSNTIGGYIDASLTRSSNAASCALIKLLWDHDAVDTLNQHFQDLGLETLQLVGTNPVNGGHWGNTITMSSLDTAKLLVLINGAGGTLWKTPAGVPVTAAELSPASHQLFVSELGQEGFNWMLSTTNYCGASYPAPGIPQLTADRWISADGTMTVDGNYFGRDVRPCNAAAQVTFAHKPGWVNNTGSDAGIVTSLPGEAHRHYVITVFSNLGDQYIDPTKPAAPAGTTPAEYTEKFAQLGLAVDRYETQRAHH